MFTKTSSRYESVIHERIRCQVYLNSNDCIDNVYTVDIVDNLCLGYDVSYIL